MTALRRLGRLLSLPRRRADDPPDPVPGRLFDPLAPSSALPALIVRPSHSYSPSSSGGMSTNRATWATAWPGISPRPAGSRPCAA